MIKVENVTKRYGAKVAVDDASFEIQKGEVVGFLGRNGAGKTTCMNIITGYISATSGSASVDGFNILEHPLEVKKRVGYLPEQPPLYMDMTVQEYLGFVCDIKAVKGSRKTAHIGDICDLVGIADMRTRLIKNLSKGYKQRVGMAQALVGNPEVLILDEPTVGLDPRQIIEIRHLIRDLGKEHTVVLSSHILSEVAEVCERVIIIDHGKIVAQDTLDHLERNVKDITRLSLRVANATDDLKKTIRNIHGVRFVDVLGCKEEGTLDFIVESDVTEDVRAEIFRTLAAAQKPLLMLRPMDVTLEDVFMQLTSEDK